MKMLLFHSFVSFDHTSGPNKGCFSCWWPLLDATKSAPKKFKNIFFQDKFYSLEVYAHYFIVLKYLTTWRAAKLGICALFTSINVLQCSQSINPLMYVYDTDPHAFYESLMLVMVTLKSSWVQNHQWVVLRSTQSSFFLGWWIEYQVLLGTQM